MCPFCLIALERSLKQLLEAYVSFYAEFLPDRFEFSIDF